MTMGPQGLKHVCKDFIAKTSRLSDVEPPVYQMLKDAEPFHKDLVAFPEGTQLLITEMYTLFQITATKKNL